MGAGNDQKQPIGQPTPAARGVCGPAAVRNHVVYRRARAATGRMGGPSPA